MCVRDSVAVLVPDSDADSVTGIVAEAVADDDGDNDNDSDADDDADWPVAEPDAVAVALAESPEGDADPLPLAEAEELPVRDGPERDAVAVADDEQPDLVDVAQLATALEPFSRSAQHGGALRPWRSFEDTMDSNRPGPSQAHVPVAPAVGAITPSSPLSAPPLSGAGNKADDTGPSTAITMPTVRNIHATSVHGLTQRAQAASSRPDSSAAIANAKATEKPT